MGEKGLGLDGIGIDEIAGHSLGIMLGFEGAKERLKAHCLFHLGVIGGWYSPKRGVVLDDLG